MKYAIAVDSSSDLTCASQLGLAESGDIGFGVASLKIQAGDRHWVDDADLDVAEMATFLSTYKGRSGTACPSTGAWIEAFNGAKEVFGVTITSHLSGSYNSAKVAAEVYEAENPGAKVHIVDSLSAGPQLWMIAEKMRELIEKGLSFEEIRDGLEDYRDNSVRTIFSLQSLMNLANNGRINPMVAKMSGMLGIRIVGCATNGELDPQHKVRGEKKALATILKDMKESGFSGGKVRIAHVLNEGAALKLKALILEAFPAAQVFINEARGLDTFYAEIGGLILAFEL